MHTVGTLIQEIFPNGTPQHLGLPTDGGPSLAFRCPLDPDVIEERKSQTDTNGDHYDPYSYEQIRIREAYKKRWTIVEPDELTEALKILLRADISPWFSPPHDPIDLFAVCGRLLERSGAYHHVEACTWDSDGNCLPAANRIIQVTADDRADWTLAGEGWRSKVDVSTNVAPTYPPEIVEYYWVQLISAWSSPLFSPIRYDGEAPAWWRFALALMIIADEAAEGVGQRSISRRDDDESSWVARAVDARITRSMDILQSSLSIPEQDDLRLYTLSEANPDAVCVLPKSRTTQVGCTIRNLSHNLALLPPQGVARAAWFYGQQPGEHQKGKPLNMILIPYPYEIEATCFRQIGDSGDDCDKKFGWFGVSPRPLEAASEEEAAEKLDKATEAFLEFVDGLIRSMVKDFGKVDMLVFPELALTHRLHDKLLDWVNRNHNDIEVVVAGLTSYSFDTDVQESEEGSGIKESRIRYGNFAAITVFSERAPDEIKALEEDPDIEDFPPRQQMTSYHDKHHRWRLDREQITRYGLGATLDPSCDWWERQDMLSRRLTVIAFRDKATATVLICEDLARTDPAQEVLRAIGPKLIFALLMDGPQLMTRWPARYATVLADDPGSSVLTLTSMALIERANASGKHAASHCVGLWRDADGDTQELKVAPGFHGLGLSLSQVEVTEQTMDGRRDADAATWILSGVRPLKSVSSDGKPAKETPPWIE